MSLTIAEVHQLVTVLLRFDEPPGALVVTGSRVWADQRPMVAAVKLAFQLIHVAAPRGVELIVGDADGVDQAATTWRHPGWRFDGAHAPEWDSCGDGCPNDHGTHRRRNHHGAYCPLAGHRRNQVLIDRAVRVGNPVCLGFQHHHSTGTADCLRRATAAGIPTWTWHR